MNEKNIKDACDTKFLDTRADWYISGEDKNKFLTETIRDRPI